MKRYFFLLLFCMSMGVVAGDTRKQVPSKFVGNQEGERLLLINRPIKELGARLGGRNVTATNSLNRDSILTTLSLGAAQVAAEEKLFFAIRDIILTHLSNGKRRTESISECEFRLRHPQNRPKDSDDAHRLDLPYKVCARIGDTIFENAPRGFDPQAYESLHLSRAAYEAIEKRYKRQALLGEIKQLVQADIQAGCKYDGTAQNPQQIELFFLTAKNIALKINSVYSVDGINNVEELCKPLNLRPYSIEQVKRTCATILSRNKR